MNNIYAIQMFDAKTGDYCGCFTIPEDASFECPEGFGLALDHDGIHRAWFLEDELDQRIDEALAIGGVTVEAELIS